MGLGGSLVLHRCVSPDHRFDGTGFLTVHEGAWAWCPDSRAAQMHQWTPLANPVTFAQLRFLAAGTVSESIGREARPPAQAGRSPRV